MQVLVNEKMGGNELHQRINDLKERRRNNRINLILNAAANGNLTGLKEAFKVCLVNVELIWYAQLNHSIAERKCECV